ncbi:hypothetical protein N7490_000634 [Penicillium lividum]|nr:hypothetical protein N7490_000634 [Penicillium lividum]
MACSQNPAIIFQNTDETVYLIDIPKSIAHAQLLQATVSNQECVPTGKTSQRSLISTVPLMTPYPSQTEPKKDSARAKILSRITPSDQRFHGEFIQPLVASALDELRDRFLPSDARWCVPRTIQNETVQGKELSGSFDPFIKKRKLENPQNVHSPLHQADDTSPISLTGPPTILSSSSVNTFSLTSELEGLVKNPSSEEARLSISTIGHDGKRSSSEYLIPPRSAFVLCTLPLSQPEPLETPIPGIPGSQRFNLILFDPPWPNRSVHRSKEYQTHSYNGMDILSQRLHDILRVHAYDLSLDDSPKSATQLSSQESFAAIWITNSEKARKVAYESLLASGFRIHEEWIWIKITADGQTVYPLDGLWRKPYEILVIGRKDMSPVVLDAGRAKSQENDLLGVDPSTITRRVIAAVPDLHSRKPNLKSVFERVLFGSTLSTRKSYSALEVFARSLTSEWWACGNEVVKFNSRDCWFDHDSI